MTIERTGEIWSRIEKDEIVLPRALAADEEQLLLTHLNAEAARIENELDADLYREMFKPPYPPSDWNYASKLGHPCEKHLVHARVDCLEQRSSSVEGFWRMWEGIEYERRTKARLSRIGYELSQTQSRFRWPRFKISGKVDGLTPIKTAFPEPFAGLRETDAEIKSVNPVWWDSTRTIEDIRTHRCWWIRGYPSQLNIYLILTAKPGGFFVLTTFGRRPRVLVMTIDWTLAERDLLMAERVNRHVAAGTYPAPIPYDEQVCGMCAYSHLCQPLKLSQISTTISIQEQFQLEGFIQVQEQFREIRKAYEARKKDLIGDSKNHGRFYGHNALVNDIVIESVPRHRKAYSVAECDYVETSIERMSP